jgi:hypothetical protein
VVALQIGSTVSSHKSWFTTKLTFAFSPFHYGSADCRITSIHGAVSGCSIRCVCSNVIDRIEVVSGIWFRLVSFNSQGPAGIFEQAVVFKVDQRPFEPGFKFPVLTRCQGRDLFQLDNFFIYSVIEARAIGKETTPLDDDSELIDDGEEPVLECNDLILREVDRNLKPLIEAGIEFMQKKRLSFAEMDTIKSNVEIREDGTLTGRTIDDVELDEIAVGRRDQLKNLAHALLI